MKLPGLLAFCLLCCGCRTESHNAPPPAGSGSHMAADPQGARAALDELDRRRPVPLLPVMAQHQKQNMREHLEAVQEVVAGTATGDFEKVATASKRLGYSEAMGRMCEHMGAAAPGFTEQALAFHHTADAITAAAERQDGPAVLNALSQTLQACTACHASYKQQLVAELPE